MSPRARRRLLAALGLGALAVGATSAWLDPATREVGAARESGDRAVDSRAEGRRGSAAGTRGRSGGGTAQGHDESGAASPNEAFERFQRAIEVRDRAALVRGIAPSTREAWLRGVLVELAAETTETASRDHEHRDVRRALRALLLESGAYVRERPQDVGPEPLGRALVAKVDDRDGLYARLLDFADEHRTPLDPVRAVTSLAEGSASAAPLSRLVARVAAPSKVVEVDDRGDGGPTLFVDGPEGRVVVRVHRGDGGGYWLDES